MKPKIFTAIAVASLWVATIQAQAPAAPKMPIDEVSNLIDSVDDDGSGRIEFDEFLRIIHNKSKKKSKNNEKITTFFKNLANDNISNESDLKHFSFTYVRLP